MCMLYGFVHIFSTGISFVGKHRVYWFSHVRAKLISGEVPVCASVRSVQDRLMGAPVRWLGSGV